MDVVEVGMGWRLEATNIVPEDTALVSFLTVVDLEHRFFFRETVGEIALRKLVSQWVKRPFVMGFQIPDRVQ